MTGEQLRDLEGARDAAPRDGARREIGDGLSVEGDADAGRADIGGSQNDEWGLARAVRSEENGDGAARDDEVQIGEGRLMNEALVDRSDLDGCGGGRSVRSRHRFFIGIAPRT